MAYLGEVPNPVNRGLTQKDTFTGDGSTTTFDLTTAIPNVTENDIEVFVDNVRQEPGTSDAYTLGFDGSSNFKRITFTEAPESGSEIYVLSGEAQTQIIVVADGSITGNKISSTFDISGKTVTLPASVSGLGTGITNDQLAGSIANAKLANSSFTLNGVTVNLGDTTSIAAGTDWQPVVVADGSTVTSAVASEGYFINTTSAAHTIQLPSSPSIGDEVSVIDYAGTFDTNNLTVDRNGKNIQGSAADLTVATERAGFTLVFVDDTQGWLLKDK